MEIPFIGKCRHVEEFEKLEQLGEGTYGTVYRAKDKKNGEIVALKRVKMEHEEDGIPITAIREISLLKSIEHRNVVRLQEVLAGSRLKSIFLVFEYCEHDLGHLIDRMPHSFSESEVKCIMIQLLSGVSHLHDKWIIHRDVKMSNLLYTSKGYVKIGDFGLARLFGMPPNKPYTPHVVTLWYRAPELILGMKDYTIAVDMWAVGCIFGELLLHRTLFPGKTEAHQFKLITDLLGVPHNGIWPGVEDTKEFSKFVFSRNRYSSLHSLFSRFSDSCIDLLDRLLTYDPEKRLSASEALMHPFFNESPLPKSVSMMPTFCSRDDARIEDREKKRQRRE